MRASSHIVLINDVNSAKQRQHARALSHIKQRNMELRVFDITARWLDGLQLLDPCRLLLSYPVIPSFVNVCIYFEWFSPVATFRTGFSFVEYCSGSFRAFLQSD